MGASGLMHTGRNRSRSRGGRNASTRRWGGPTATRTFGSALPPRASWPAGTGGTIPIVEPQTPSQLVADLRALGLSSGDAVMVHASLRAIGPVHGRAEGVIDAIHETIGAEGTMIMLLGARDDHAWVDARPETERLALLAEAEPFDAATTPADPEVGVLAEVFRRHPEVQVSDHPEGRFAASGQHARALTSDVPWNDYFGPGSTLERLVALDAKVLRLGADLATVTMLHLAEYRCAVRPRRRVRRYRSVWTPAGPAVRIVSCLDDEHGIVDYPGGDYFADILVDYLAAGRGSSGIVGRARSELLDAADFVGFGVDWMDRHLVAEPAPSVAELQARLDADLLVARRHRGHPAVAAIRALKSALANAEALPVSDGPFRLVDGGADVPRRVLTGTEIAAVVEAELAERQRAIDEYRRLGVDTTVLELERSTLERYREWP
jgi:aminoglycoside 3-N-acetyltransferase